MSGFVIKAEVIGAVEVEAKLRRAGSTVHAEVLKAVQELGLRLLGHVKADKLSGQVLQVRTGRLRRSINVSYTDASGSVYATVGTNVVYARINELGGTTSPHDIVAKNGKALAFIANWGPGRGQGGATLLRKVHHPGSKIPERSFLRSALADMHGEILERLQRALSNAVNGG